MEEYSARAGKQRVLQQKSNILIDFLGSIACLKTVGSDATQMGMLKEGTGYITGAETANTIRAFGPESPIVGHPFLDIRAMRLL